MNIKKLIYLSYIFLFWNLNYSCPKYSPSVTPRISEQKVVENKYNTEFASKLNYIVQNLMTQEIQKRGKSILSTDKNGAEEIFYSFNLPNVNNSIPPTLYHITSIDNNPKLGDGIESFEVFFDVFSGGSISSLNYMIMPQKGEIKIKEVYREGIKEIVSLKEPTPKEKKEILSSIDHLFNYFKYSSPVVPKVSKQKVVENKYHTQVIKEYNKNLDRYANLNSFELVQDNSFGARLNYKWLNDYIKSNINLNSKKEKTLEAKLKFGTRIGKIILEARGDLNIQNRDVYIGLSISLLK